MTRAGVAAPNIATDREELTDYVPFEAVYTRADGATIDELVPSDSYGRLLPFDGGLVHRGRRDSPRPPCCKA